MTLGARTRVILGLRWVGKRDDLDFSRPVGSRRITLDPYTHVNIAAEYTLGLVQLTGKVENAFDDQSPEISGYPVRGRTVLLGGRLIFGM